MQNSSVMPELFHSKWPLTQAAEVEAGSEFLFFFIIVIIVLQEMEGETGFISLIHPVLPQALSCKNAGRSVDRT